jgi:hypothetical protein
MKAKIILELDLEEAAALSHLIANSSHDDLVKKTMSEHRAELVKRIYSELPAFSPPGYDNRSR